GWGSRCARGASPPTGGCWPPSSSRRVIHDRRSDHHEGVSLTRSLACPGSAPPPGAGPVRSAIGPRRFASRERLSREQPLRATVRWPPPSRPDAELDVPPGKMARGLRELGLTSVGALLEHLPRDTRDARTVKGLAAGEVATVAVQVRAIALRPVRRRGMRPLVQATVFD